MKVQVNFQTASKTNTSSEVLDLSVTPSDTVLTVKERIATAQMVAFPDQDLMLNGEVLADGLRLSDCGVKESSSLDFVVRASEEGLVKQFTELLQARDLSCDELGLLYCYKHGVSVSQALKAVGHDGKFPDFMKKQKVFLVENGRATLVRADTTLQPFSVRDEVKRMLEESDTGSMMIPTLCSKFVQKFNVSIASMTKMKPSDFFAHHMDVFVVSGRGVVSLKPAGEQQRVLRRETPPPAAVPVQRMRRRETPPLAAVPVPPMEEVQQTVDEEVYAIHESDTTTSEHADDNQQYLDLHTKVSGRSFNSKVAQALTAIVDLVLGSLFLNVDHVVKGGCVGKGTAIAGVSDAEVIFFLKGMPASTQNKWLPPLLKSVASVLAECVADNCCIEDVRVSEDSLQLRVSELGAVQLRFSPTFESYTEAVQVMSKQSPDGRRLLEAAFAKERVQFIAKQPGQVKVTMRLLKWWREQQEWSSALTRPTDDILELMVVYSAAMTKPGDQQAAVANVMSLLARFDEMRIVWSNYYGKEDVWAPLLNQRPLLMDPVNPFVNVASPNVFDPCELVAAAKTTHFFW